MYKNYTKNRCVPLGDVPETPRMLNSAMRRLYSVDKRKWIMRINITTFLIILSLIQVSASTLAQKVTIHQTNIPLREVFKQITAQTGYDILYDANLLNEKSTVNLNLSSTSISEALQQVLKDQELAFEIKGNTIIVTAKEPGFLAKIKEALGIPIVVNGRVTDSLGVPLPGATIKIKPSGKTVNTDSNGGFKFNAEEGAEVSVSFVGYQTVNFKVTEDMGFQNIILKALSGELKEVIVHTGYQDLPKERATGSFEVISSKKINEQVGANILDRLNGISSLLFDASGNSGAAFTIRGINTINGNRSPLVVVDNFPYDGDINNINPNNVESVTVLKDAAAASIWGARAGNGVLVITTKKGNFNQNMKVAFSAGFTLSDKPNYFAQKLISPSDYIDIEKLKFANGFYNDYENSFIHPYLTPVVEALIGQRDGTLTTAAANSIIDSYRNHDIRTDATKLGQKPFNQQYSLDISGGTNNMNYFLSGGYNNDISSSNASNKRMTLNAANTYKVIKDLSITTSLQFSQGNSRSGNKASGSFPGLAPYTRLIDDNGNPLAVDRHRTSYLDTVGGGKLLDWHYYPVIDATHTIQTDKVTDFTAGLALQYRFLKNFNANVSYQFQRQLNSTESLNDEDSYYIRDLVNQYTVIDPVTGKVTYNFPKGGKLFTDNGNITSNNLRGSLSFARTWNKHELNILTGTEIRSNINDQGTRNIFYGYIKDPLNFINVDPNGSYPVIFGYTDSPFGDANPVIRKQIIAHSVSAFANASYIYDEKYIFSASARRDATNVYGVSTNNKWKPLWSGGFAWNIDKESFYKVDFLPTLKMRTTYGVAGNNPLQPALTVVQAAGINFAGASFARIRNFANPDLQWEDVRTLNFALDFGTKNNTIMGSIEYYTKRDKNLLGPSILDPSAGIGTLGTPLRNIASMKSNGFDFNLNSNNLKGSLEWHTNFIMNIHHDKVTDYYNPIANNYQYVSGGEAIIGQTLYPLITYKWFGLDPQTGEPVGTLNGLPSKDIGAIQNNTNLADLTFHGSAIPTIFGSLNNSFSYKNFNLGINITYKLGYYFKKQSVDYSDLIAGNASNGSADYVLRWQKPGDERFTNVPAFQYPNDSNDLIYYYSDALVRKGDHIRLQFINFGYNFTKKMFRRLPVEQLSITFNAANLGILWRSNKDNIDPDANGGIPAPKIYSLTLRTNF